MFIILLYLQVQFTLSGPLRGVKGERVKLGTQARQFFFGGEDAEIYEPERFQLMLSNSQSINSKQIFPWSV